MRKIYRTDEFNLFFETADQRLREKIVYISEIIATQTIINTKIAKRLVNTDLYEIRIKTDNEYRILTFTMDNKDINQCKKLIFINAFKKKDTKDYNKHIKVAIKILEQWGQ
ncbi:addiction module toxin RelE [Riemerella anatipestifer]|uniref:Type II toxin-antitoxin system RelE/ParE family toxin n=1 Tax=Riemerella anatipestifer TaxID=34085 RepID=A0AAP3AN74_RIEAN|nr:type II toxin-antitoxin system RelE/ParE family toxin [Riemerella anatipestifer]MBT0572070.1 type II toxin-antitoxin system RelE/ParE family toxin [Riemerella anatipestifer]MCU7569207.1 type II toxin-antitoxin system RelE/ParE family toxin [Riemerella anatipestifer]MCW0491162.1 type II toxin-antitoxin system RelE/ParE family toxin [Riemerella anatipestifer]MCW0524747.1 type II toxin-antitoxin system RelE/ParE family toxin [Riemerella anatipestifer]MDD1524153.1 addiction module toxin RelE [R